MEQERTERISMRLPPDLRQALDGAANKERRTLTNMAEVLLREAIAARAAQKKGAKR